MRAVSAAPAVRTVRDRIGPDPERLKEFAETGNVSVIYCLPTIAAILLIPRHFFRRLRPGGGRAIPLSVSPMKLILNSAAIVTIGLAFFNIQNEKYLVLGIALAVAVSSPLWMTALVGFTACAAIVSRKAQLRRVGLLHFFIFRIVGYVLPLESAIFSLESLFLFRLDMKRATWGCAYLSMALFFYLLFVMAIVACLALLFGINSPRGSVAGDLLTPLLTTLFMIVLAASTHPLINAFGAMLTSVCLYPRRRYYKRMSEQLTKLSNQFYGEQFEKRDECRREIVRVIWRCVADTIRAERRICANESLTNRFLIGRGEGLATLEDMEPYLELTDELRLFKCFVALKDTRLLLGSEEVPQDIFSNRELWVPAEN